MMKKLLLLLVVSIVSVLSGKEIIFVPGWMTGGALYRKETALLKKTFPGYQVKIWHWESIKSWFDARSCSEKTSVDVANYIAEMPPEQQKEVILIGHSLGGRCAVHTAHHLKEKNIQIRQIILLGSAINRNDNRVSFCVNVSINPVFNFFCEDDHALETYNIAEIYAAPRQNKFADHSAAGQYGIPNAPGHIWQFKLKPSRSMSENKQMAVEYYREIREKRQNAQWGKILEDFKVGTNHMCNRYVTELHRIYPDAKSHKTGSIKTGPYPKLLENLPNIFKKTKIPKYRKFTL